MQQKKYQSIENSSVRSFRLNKDILAKLKEEAQKEGRTLSKQIEYIVKSFYNKDL